MSAARVVSVFVAPGEGEPAVSIGEARAVPGKGLEGDRYFKLAMIEPEKVKPGREITLIESEALEGLKQDTGIELRPEQTRRNVLTRGVALNDLVGREFRVGGVRLRGAGLCEPCRSLESQTQPGVLKGLVHRGGLAAAILSEGTIRVGDNIVVE